MPPGTPYNAFVLPYSIRVDMFTELPHDCPIIPTLHLLTHTHSDHVVGLSSKSFGYTVVCSPDAKEMLLRHEVYAERSLYENGMKVEKSRKFTHLKIDPMKQLDGRTSYKNSRDLLKTVPLNTRTRFELSGDESVMITLLSANHCPGAVMFLIEGARGSILHTGDFRVEPWFLESLTRNPILRPHLASCSAAEEKETLDAIYLDTAYVWSMLEPPTKACASNGLVELMKLYEPSVRFFLDVWTWGYEDILTAVATAFDTKIHTDRYKHAILTCISDPILSTIVTRDAACTRFHACERLDRCTHITQAKKVVYVNPVMMGSLAWDAYFSETRKKLLDGEIVATLLVPIWRHSSLPELQKFVNLFRPHRVIPNTLDPALGGLDWMCIHGMFKDYLSPEGQIVVDAIQGEVSARAESGINGGLVQWAASAGENGDIGLKNLEGGEEAESDVGQWTSPDAHGIKQLRIMRDFLVGPLREAFNDLLNQLGDQDEHINAKEEDMEQAKNWTIEGGYGRKEDGSDEETDDDHDERGRTAHKLFASFIDHEEFQSQPRNPLFAIQNYTPKYGPLPTPITSPRRAYESSSSPERSRPSHQEDPFLSKDDHKTAPKSLLFDRSTLHIGSNVRHIRAVSVDTDQAIKKQNFVHTPTTEGPDQSPKQPCGIEHLPNISIVDTSIKSKMPISPKTAARNHARAERRRIAEKLSRARPDLVVPSYTEKRKLDSVSWTAGNM